jgi:tetratricopeptide (TPR) repeat protein
VSADEGVTFGDDRPAAHAYVDIDLWVVNPQSGEVVWADAARDRRTMGVVRGAIRDDVESFLAGTLFAALNRAIWRADFLAAMGATLVPVSVAAEPNHEEIGKSLFSAGRFGAAASEFKKAYEASSDPAHLFNMALCYRKGGFAKLALWSYEQYLIKVPNSPQRAAVEERIKDLRAEIGEQ